MALDQIQIISTPGALQELIDSSIRLAFEKLNTTSLSQQGKNEQPVSTKELCSFLDITEPTLIRWRKKGKIPFLKIGSRILYQKSAVLTAIENKKGASNGK
ncbi:helix-turn-helix domain-containing protein [uncultured Mucilaginibacter sp.]|uniref:helix-turn-helix domain-containing protein n=1 Tax=uncultured Mucilaginibacter sp. TaxID=797541 RepID=UPI0025DBCBB9|nr:helix-turn-helix domain-containing protein [uncultured Mucilaginibacter sp.]